MPPAAPVTCTVGGESSYTPLESGVKATAAGAAPPMPRGLVTEEPTEIGNIYVPRDEDPTLMCIAPPAF